VKAWIETDIGNRVITVINELIHKIPMHHFTFSVAWITVFHCIVGILVIAYGVVS
jgi:hypothetical protein